MKYIMSPKLFMRCHGTANHKSHLKEEETLSERYYLQDWKHTEPQNVRKD